MPYSKLLYLWLEIATLIFLAHYKSYGTYFILLFYPFIFLFIFLILFFLPTDTYHLFPTHPSTLMLYVCMCVCVCFVSERLFLFCIIVFDKTITFIFVFVRITFMTNTRYTTKTICI